MHKSYKSDFIAKLVGGICTDSNIIITNISSLPNAKNNSICFFNDLKYKKELGSTNAAIVILRESNKNLYKGPSIFVDDPYLAYAKIASLFFEKKYSNLIHENSFIEPSCKIGNNISIGAYSSIGVKTKIEDGVHIGSNSFIGDNAVIGKNSIIHSNVTIESNVQIGKNCEIFSGARIGTDGFGYARDKDRSWLKIPQTGSVIIGNNVDVGANTTIDRGAIENTIIHDGVKIDNLVQIGHNCIIGSNTIIAGCAGVAGSTHIGKNCMIGGAAMIKGHITIADDTIISGGTGIGKNIENPGKRFTNVFPYNLEHKDWLRVANNLKKLGKKND